MDDLPGEGLLPVTVVVPMRDEVRSIGGVIHALRQQTAPPTEVLLVDAGSVDATMELARTLTVDDGRFRLIDAGDATPGRARNVGIAAAGHEWIALADAGTRIEAEWLQRLWEPTVADSALEVVYGNFEPLTTSFFERGAAICYIQPKRASPAGALRWPTTASMLLRRSLWEKAGRFPDLRAAEDQIFTERVAAIGPKSAWAPAATVWWEMPPSLLRTFRRFRLYSKHNVLVGRQSQWHYGVARSYLAACPFAALSVIHRRSWLAGIALPSAARVGKLVWRVKIRGDRTALNPRMILTVAAILLVTDAATFVGWLDALRERRPRQVGAPPFATESEPRRRRAFRTARQ